ncbi:type IV pilus biogenesis protein PilM [Falsibacillus pallidus]|uniref:type IV pilus biogenesis protein PilM n=1 Tax=Falsibacillus pallidus TaxID=493781 RepID=UPI003D98A6C4
MAFILGGQRKLHVMFTDRYFRFLETGKNFSLIKYGQKLLPTGLIHEGEIQDYDTLFTILDQYMGENRLKRLPVYMNLLDGHTIVRKVQVPAEIPSDEIKGYLYMEIGESLHLPFEDPVLQVEELEQKEGYKEVLLLAVKESVVKTYINLLEELKCRPEVMDLSILSLYRLYYHLDLHRPDQHLLQIQLFVDCFQLSIFHDHKPIYVRYQALPDTMQGELQRTRTGFEVMEAPDEPTGKAEHLQIMVQEIDRLINFYRYNMTKGEHQLNKFTITGDHPFLEEFTPELENQLGINIQSLAQPFFQTTKDMNIPYMLNECIGLSLK